MNRILKIGMDVHSTSYTFYVQWSPCLEEKTEFLQTFR